MSDQAPIGSLMASGALLSSSRQALFNAGWLPCDGTAYAQGTGSPYNGLFAVIGNAFGGATGTFNVPDFRGRFLRGTNRDANPARDVDNATRAPSASGGNSGNMVGSVQEWATGLPQTAFTTDINSPKTHTHDAPHQSQTGQECAVAIDAHNINEWNSDTTTTDSQGAHTHTMSAGGDAETRPANLYVYWFIKFA